MVTNSLKVIISHSADIFKYRIWYLHIALTDADLYMRLHFGVEIRSAGDFESQFLCHRLKFILHFGSVFVVISLDTVKPHGFELCEEFHKLLIGNAYKMGMGNKSVAAYIFN